jgi:ABC-type multidrug transport system ATPase subunit
MIEIEHLSKTFGRATAVADFSLSIRPGESVALWGENGAGKSTIIRCVLGLLRYRGSVRIAELDAWRHGKRARRLIGYVPQELGFYDDLRVAEALGVFGRLNGERVDDANAVLARVGLAGHAGKRIRELSGGMKQRLALAIALLGDPPILVLDEVTASLDACGRAEFVALLASLTRSRQRATLFASHRVEEIDALATRVVTLERGRTIGDMPAADFVRRATGQTVLHVFLGGDRVSDALAVLSADGFAARRNGRGIFIATEPGCRARALHRLAQADIRVADFEIIPATAAKETTP